MKESILRIINRRKNGIKYDEILSFFSHDEFLECNKAIFELEEDFEILKEKGKYYTLKQLDLFKGEVQITNSGVGFLLTNDEVLKDIFIYSEDLHKALNKDICLVKVKPNKKSRSGLRVGEVIKVKCFQKS